MDVVALQPIADDLMANAPQHTTRHRSKNVCGGGGHALAQNVVAICAGTSLGEYANPGESSVLVLRGRVRLHHDSDTAEAGPSELLILPAQGKTALEAIEDSVVLWTLARQLT